MKSKKMSICHCINIRRTSRKITAIYDEFLKPCELNVTQYSLLANLKIVQPIKMNDFTKVVNLERTTLLRNLKPLINQNLIELQSIEKTKAQLIKLTNEGLELQEKSSKYWKEAQNFIEKLIQPTKLDIFYEVIGKIDTLEI